jgi:amino acid adenylation domain-containing protein
MEERPLTKFQQGLWMEGKLHPESSAYNVPRVFEIQGYLDSEALQYALNQVIKKNASFRLKFFEKEGLPFQGIVDEVNFVLSKNTLQKREDLTSYVESCIKTTIDLERGPNFSFHLLSFGKDIHFLVFIGHHLAHDGISMKIYAQDLSKYYKEKIEKMTSEVDTKKANREYLEAIDYYLLQEPAQASGDFWRKYLEGANFQIPFPFRRNEHPHKDSTSIRFSSTLTAAIRTMAKAHKKTPFLVFMAAYALLLYRYFQQAEMVIGYPVNLRTPQLKEVAGLFINTLPFRIQVSDDMTFLDLMEQVSSGRLQSAVHQHFSLGDIIHAVRQGKHSFRRLFNVMFGQSSFALASLDFPEARVTTFVDYSREALEEVNFVYDDAGEFVFKLECNHQLFDKAFAHQLCFHWQRLIEKVIANPEKQLGDFSLLNEQEKNAIVHGFNQTQKEFPQSSLCIHQLFEEQAEKRPESIAITFQDSQLTYGQLNAKANQLAHYLRKRGVKEETLVALSLGRSPLIMIGMLGILKAGGAILPLDPSYPEERLKFMAKDADAYLILTESASKEKFADYHEKVIVLDTEQQINAESTESPPFINTLQNMAYVIYTSGSTGTPKGVMVEHQNLTNLALNMVQFFRITPQSRMLQFNSMSFDVLMGEWPCTFCQGATLCMIPTNQLAGNEFVDFCNKQSITHTVLPCAFLPRFPADSIFTSLEGMIYGGETCPEEIYNLWRKNIPLYNAYGPTETTVITTYSPCGSAPSNRVIGRPISNTTLYLLDKSLNPVPIGIDGEIFIGGEGVARGYLNREEVTKEKFIANPFVSEEEKAKGKNLRIYRSGDIGRWQPDGNVEFLGRVDHQIKIRGFRVEIGEIEAAISKYKTIDHVAVLMVPGASSSLHAIVAYVVDKDLTDKDLQDPSAERIAKKSSLLKQHLSKFLPDYMIPSAFMFLETMPLTPNGKIDTKALPKFQPARSTLEQFKEARNELEQELTALWSEVLGIKKIGINDQFFELGGDSILMNLLFGKIKQLQSKEINTEILSQLQLVDLYKYPTIVSLTAHLAASQESQIAIPSMSKRSQQMKLSLQKMRSGKI